MPELPEVEIVKQSLQNKVIYKKINKVLIRNRNLRFKIQKNLEKCIINKKIKNVKRKSKYLIIYLEEDKYLIIHLGMSGTLHIIRNNELNNITNLSFYHSKILPKKHNHVEFFFNKFKIVYNDPRRFGFIKLLFSKKEYLKYFNKIGPEPFEKKFSYDYLEKKLCYRKRNIKNFLLDQSIISGIGNIYANEILYYAKINPLKEGEQINKNQIKKLMKFSIYVLKKSINRGGSTIKDFKNIKGTIGLFQNEFKVYSREGKSCLNKKCKGKIKKIVISNRATYFCKFCQKN